MVQSKPEFIIRFAEEQDLPGAREVMLDILTNDFGTGYIAQYHWDLDDLNGTYLENPRHALFVAVDTASGSVAATTALRQGGPKSPPHPQWLAERYDAENVAQLFRVYVAGEYRRFGLARRLVEALREWVAANGAYDVICLHTNPNIPGAEPFWRSMPTTEIHVDRGNRPDYDAIHFELAIPGRD
ncbi:MAG: GNAT family N-acetyltransferase [Thermomicrobiales bacterium]